MCNAHSDMALHMPVEGFRTPSFREAKDSIRMIVRTTTIPGSICGLPRYRLVHSRRDRV